MGKFLGGLILGVVAVGAVFVAIPPKAIDNAKQWTETAKTDVVKFFTPDKDNTKEDKDNKGNIENGNEKDNKDSADNIEVTKPAPPQEESESTAYVIEQINELYNNQK